MIQSRGTNNWKKKGIRIVPIMAYNLPKKIYINNLRHQESPSSNSSKFDLDSDPFYGSVLNSPPTFSVPSVGKSVSDVGSPLSFSSSDLQEKEDRKNDFDRTDSEHGLVTISEGILQNYDESRLHGSKNQHHHMEDQDKFNKSEENNEVDPNQDMKKEFGRKSSKKGKRKNSDQAVSENDWLEHYGLQVKDHDNRTEPKNLQEPKDITLTNGPCAREELPSLEIPPNSKTITPLLSSPTINSTSTQHSASTYINNSSRMSFDSDSGGISTSLSPTMNSQGQNMDVGEIQSCGIDSQTNKYAKTMTEKCMKGDRINSRARAADSTKKKKKNIPPCQICNDVAGGFHCGAFVCEACKKFFLRSLANKAAADQYKCVRSNNCEITKSTRGQCQFCRLQRCLELGLYKPGGREEQKLQVDFKQIPCKVCNSPSSGYHFGVITCEGCKGFFRRMAREQQHRYMCIHGGHCDVTSATRTCCKPCRYTKCVEVGMTLEGSRIGRRSNQVKRATLMQLGTDGVACMETDPIKIKEEPYTPSCDSDGSPDMSFQFQSVGDYKAEQSPTQMVSNGENGKDNLNRPLDDMGTQMATKRATGIQSLTGEKSPNDRGDLFPQSSLSGNEKKLVDEVLCTIGNNSTEIPSLPEDNHIMDTLKKYSTTANPPPIGFSEPHNPESQHHSYTLLLQQQQQQQHVLQQQQQQEQQHPLHIQQQEQQQQPHQQPPPHQHQYKTNAQHRAVNLSVPNCHNLQQQQTLCQQSTIPLHQSQQQFVQPHQPYLPFPANQRSPQSKTQTTKHVPGLNEQQQETLQMILKAYDMMDEISVRPPKLEELSNQMNSDDLNSLWQVASQSFVHHMGIIIRFVKKVPRFRKIVIEDQIVMLQNACYAITLLHHSQFFNLATKTGNFFVHTDREKDMILAQFPIFNKLKEHFQVTGQVFQELGMTATERILLSVIFLFNIAMTDGSCLKEREQAAIMLEEMAGLLEAVCEANQNQQESNRFGKLMAQLPILQKFTIEQRKMSIEAQRAKPDVDFGDLWNELFDKNSKT